MSWTITPDRKSQIPEDLAHPLAVAPREVVVDRDEVDALARKRVQVDRKEGDEGLALSGRHLRDPALVEHDRRR